MKPENYDQRNGGHGPVYDADGQSRTCPRGSRAGLVSQLGLGQFIFWEQIIQRAE